MADQQVTTEWTGCEEVVLYLPYGVNETQDFFLWMMFNVGRRGFEWVSLYDFDISPATFYFKDPKAATLLRIKWGHLCKSS